DHNPESTQAVLTCRVNPVGMACDEPGSMGKTVGLVLTWAPAAEHADADDAHQNTEPAGTYRNHKHDPGVSTSRSVPGNLSRVIRSKEDVKCSSPPCCTLNHTLLRNEMSVDYFGPIEVKRGRAMAKRYGVIVTCPTSRPVHLEVEHSLDTDSCVNAFRRFISRRAEEE
ncbi:hypothetical protein NFI96_001189, partial [Prochilodus magdalenae]